MKTTPQLFCVAEDWMLLEGGVLYGFTRVKLAVSSYKVLHYYYTCPKFGDPALSSKFLE